jgi:hypothetical protein
MLTELTSSPYFLSAVVLVLAGLTFTLTSIIALFRARTGSFMLQILLGVSLLGIGGLTGMISLGIHGYKALAREEVVAKISVSPIAPQRFSATFRYPDGSVANYIIAGDEIYIDAHIIKWQPIANLIGLHTAYELDRVGGRYRELEQERTAERTIHALSQDKPVNLFKLRQLHTFLSVLLDAKYGSATFVPVTQAAELELRVSTSGLLIRELRSGTEAP